MDIPVNPFQSRYDLCNNGSAEDKNANLPPFPHIIDVELTSSCNFRCLMCPTGNLSLKREANFMVSRVMEGIIDQCAEHGTAIRFIGWGEPTLHPSLPAFIRKAWANNLPTHVNTNGSKIDPELAWALVDAGLSSIKFSFQGVDRESYKEMRQTEFFDGMLKAIGHMKKARAAGMLPYIAASTSITYETPEMVEAFRKRIEPLVDHLSIGRTIFDFMDMKAVRLRPAQRSMLERLKKLASVSKKHPDPCPEVYDKLSVHADGNVVVCCNDYDGHVVLGNVLDTPIADIWRHPKIEAYRERLARKDYSGPLCSVCYDYQNLSPGEGE